MCNVVNIALVQPITLSESLTSFKTRIVALIDSVTLTEAAGYRRFSGIVNPILLLKDIEVSGVVIVDNYEYTAQLVDPSIVTLEIVKTPVVAVVQDKAVSYTIVDATYIDLFINTTDNIQILEDEQLKVTTST